jgi:hypothetical protein
MPMQPSTQVTHIPDAGVMDSSVLFFVSVAADEFTLDNVDDIVYSSAVCVYFFCISQATHGSI